MIPGYSCLQIGNAAIRLNIITGPSGGARDFSYSERRFCAIRHRFGIRAHSDAKSKSSSRWCESFLDPNAATPVVELDRTSRQSRSQTFLARSGLLRQGYLGTHHALSSSP